MSVIVTIEGGGTYTRAASHSEDGRLLRQADGGPSNPSAYGVRTASNCITELVKALLSDEERAGARIYAALAGAAEPAVRDAIAAELEEALQPSRVWITTDLHALLHANAGDSAGILAIAGTGAAVLARDKAGNLASTGGWGVLFGDEGSAYAIALEALRKCARSLDGVEMKTVLTEMLPSAAGLEHFSGVARWAAQAAKKDIANLAVAVAHAAEEGDAAARACIEEQARKLAVLVVSAGEKLGLDSETTVFEYGGMLEHCVLFRSVFRDAVHGKKALVCVPCMRRGHEAILELARLDSVPYWIAARECDSMGERTASLPSTETTHGGVPIDRLPVRDLVLRMHAADREAVDAVGAAKDAIAAAIEYAAESLEQGGRIIYAGAGTSGRLGALDASECPPTFGVSPERVCALIAGGDRALRFSVEGAEDDSGLGAADLQHLQAGHRDTVIGIAASGNTPYVDGVLRAAKSAGARTALITSNPRAAIQADLQILLDTGPEVLTGSTRLKAGTAAKLALNMISTGAFTRAGFVYQGRMIGMIPANIKLRRRAARIVAELAGITEERAFPLLEESDYTIAVAILMAIKNVSCKEAFTLLEQCGGRLDRALQK